MEANFLVMMGLLLGMGMLIDGSIVVTEYADKKISEGLTRKEAYRGPNTQGLQSGQYHALVHSLTSRLPNTFWYSFRRER